MPQRNKTIRNERLAHARSVRNTRLHVQEGKQHNLKDWQAHYVHESLRHAHEATKHLLDGTQDIYDAGKEMLEHTGQSWDADQKMRLGEVTVACVNSVQAMRDLLTPYEKDLTHPLSVSDLRQLKAQMRLAYDILHNSAESVSDCAEICASQNYYTPEDHLSDVSSCTYMADLKLTLAQQLARHPEQVAPANRFSSLQLKRSRKILDDAYSNAEEAVSGTLEMHDAFFSFSPVEGMPRFSDPAFETLSDLNQRLYVMHLELDLAFEQCMPPRNIAEYEYLKNRVAKNIDTVRELLDAARPAVALLHEDGFSDDMDTEDFRTLGNISKTLPRAMGQLNIAERYLPDKTAQRGMA